MVRVPMYEGPDLHPAPLVQYDAPSIRPMEDIAGQQAEQLGRGLSEFAQGVQSLGGAMAYQEKKEQEAKGRAQQARVQKAKSDQDDLDRAEAIKGFTTYKGRVRERMHNEENGFLQTRGDQAFGPNKLAVRKELEGYREEIMRGITSPSARDLFQQRVDADDIATFTTMDNHAAQERGQYIKVQESALIASEIEDLSVLHGSPQFGDRMDALRSSVANSSAMRGQDPKVVSNAQDAASGAVYSAAVDNIALADPVKALEALNEFAKTGTLDAQYVLQKRAELEKKRDEVVGQAKGYAAWDLHKGNEAAALVDLDRQRADKEITPGQYRNALAAVEIQAAAKKAAADAAANNAFDAATKRIDQNPTMMLEEFSDAERNVLVETGRWDDVVTYHNAGRTFFDKTDVVKAAEGYLVAAESGTAAPMSEIEFRRNFLTGLSPKTYEVYNSANNRLLSGSGRRGGGGRGGQEGELDVEKDKNLALDLQDMLIKGGAIPKLGAGFTAKMDSNVPAVREAGALMLRFRRHFDPIFQQLLNDGHKYGDALQTAFKQVMQMPKGSDGVYDWARVPGTGKSDVRYTAASNAGVTNAYGDFSPEEQNVALSKWERNNAQAMRSGIEASPGELVEIMAANRTSVRDNTVAQRDAMPGVVTFEALAQQAQTVRPDKTLSEVKADILGAVDDLTRGAFRDPASPVRVHDIALDATTYADTAALPEDVVGEARGVSLAAAARYIRYISGQDYNLHSAEPADSPFMGKVQAETVADTLIDYVGGKYDPLTGKAGSPTDDIRLLTFSDAERKSQLTDARRSLAALEVSAAAAMQGYKADVQNIQEWSGTMGELFFRGHRAEAASRVRDNKPIHRILRMREIVDQLSVPYSAKWDALRPSAEVANVEEVVSPPTLKELVAESEPTPQTGQALDSRPITLDRGITGLPAEANLSASNRALLDQVRSLDRVQSMLQDAQLDLPAIGKPTAAQPRQAAEAIRSLLEDGDPKAARELVYGNPAKLAMATWIHEQILSNLPKIDRGTRGQADRPLAAVPQQSNEVVPDLSDLWRERPRQMSTLDEARMRGAVVPPKMPPQNRRIYDQLVTTYNTTLEQCTIGMGSQEVPYHMRDYLQQITRLAPQVLQGNLEEAERFLGDYEERKKVFTAVVELSKRAYKRITQQTDGNK